MEKQAVSEIKNKTTKSIISLTIRSIALQSFSIVGFILLSAIFSIQETGLFNILVELVAVMGYFSDVGLAAALIQQKGSPEDKSLRTVFFIQQMLSIVGIIVACFIYYNTSSQRSFSQSEHFIFGSLLFGFFCASLKTIPSVLLERKLDFVSLSIADIAENITFYVVAVLSALFGLGISSFALAIVIRSGIGLIVIYKKSPWSPGFAFDTKTLKSLFKFGIPYQLNSFIAIAKDKLSNIYLSTTIGLTSWGLLSWALKVNRTAISIMDAIIRVMFPAISRLQDDPKSASQVITKVVFTIALICFPVLLWVNIALPEVVSLIPKYGKWQAAIWLVPYLSINAAIAAITTPLTNAISAFGYIRRNTLYMLMWLLLTWILYPILSKNYGLNGALAAIMLVGFSSIVVWYDIYTFFSINVFSIISKVTAATLISASPLVITSNAYLSLFLSVLIFFVAIYKLEKQNLYWLIYKFKDRNV